MSALDLAIAITNRRCGSCWICWNKVDGRCPEPYVSTKEIAALVDDVIARHAAQDVRIKALEEVIRSASRYARHCIYCGSEPYYKAHESDCPMSVGNAPVKP